MNWLNINTAQSSDPLWTSSTTLAKGAWSCLMIYCTHRENDGVIAGARLWPDRQWIHATGLTADEVGDSSLWRWIGDDLHLELYPHDIQTMVVSRRANGKLGGQSKSEAKITAARTNKPRKADQNIQAKSKQNPSTIQRKEMERKEKEMEGTLSYQSALADERERDWEKVWSAFPKRVDAVKAKAVYMLSDVSPQRIIDSLADWSQTDEWTRDSGRWIPAPARWLERAGWNETPPQITRAQKEPVRCTL